MSLKSCNKLEENVYELEVSVDADTFEKAVNAAYLKQRKNISLPGFRKGKATRGMIEKMYGEGVFYEDALEAVYPEAVMSAVDEAKLDMVGQPYDVDVKELGKTGVELVLKVAVKPVIELKGYKGIKAERKPSKVTADEVKERINTVLDQNARIVTVETKRKVKKNDIAVIDFEGFVDGVAFDGGKGENYELTIGSGTFVPGFEDQIIGHKVDEEFDVNVTFPEQYTPELANKEAVFKVKLHEIKVKEVPALDDDFVKDVSEFDTVDEYKKDIKKSMEEQKKSAAENDAKNEVLDKLADLVDAKIPQPMLDAKVDEDINEFSYRLQMQGMNLDTYLKYTGMTVDTIRSQYADQAEKQVKFDLAIEKVIELEKLEAEDKDIEDEYNKMAASYNMDVEEVKKAIAPEMIKSDIVRQKALDFVIDNAKITEEKAAPKKTAAKADDGEKKPAAKKTTAKKTTKKDAE